MVMLSRGLSVFLIHGLLKKFGVFGQHLSMGTVIRVLRSARGGQLLGIIQMSPVAQKMSLIALGIF